MGFSIIRGKGHTGRDDISMQLASRDFLPCWTYTWVAFKKYLIFRTFFLMNYSRSFRINQSSFRYTPDDGLNIWKLDWVGRSMSMKENHPSSNIFAFYLQNVIFRSIEIRSSVAHITYI